jgi:hypothetical protein
VVAHLDPGDASIVPDDRFDDAVDLQLDLPLFDLLMQAVQENRFGPELVTPVDQRHLLRDVRKVKRLFHGAVAPAHHAHIPIDEEESVAGRTAAVR